MTSHPYLRWIRHLGAGVVAMLLSACLMSEEEVDPGPGPGSRIKLSGSVGDGPIAGADMRVLGIGGNVLAEFQSSASGDYSITLNVDDEAYPLMVEATGGVDLVTGAAPDFDMSGALPASGNEIANVNPFSTFAVELAKEAPGGLTRDNLEDAQEIVTTALNSGLSSLVLTGPMETRIDETNVSEIVKASETLAELLRRTRDRLQAAGFAVSAGGVIAPLASDLSDRVIDGVGGPGADSRTAAVATIVNAQVLIEAMANELRVNGVDAGDAMRSAAEQVTSAPPDPTIEQLLLTAQMLSRARIGLAAAYAVDEDPAIRQLHEVVSGFQPGQGAATVRVSLPSGYRLVLQNVLATIAGADDATLALVNAVARSNGDIAAANLAPTIGGTPATTATAGLRYSFTPTAADVDGDPLVFDISGMPAWAGFDTSTGELSGVPSAADVGSYDNIVISVSDAELTASLAPFTIAVSAGNSPPEITGSAPGSVVAGGDYSFTPSASDPDGDTLSFSVSGLPSWAAFDTATGRLSGTPGAGDVGVYTNIVISVTDGLASSSLAPFPITVEAVALGSATLIWVAPTENEDGTALTDLAGYRVLWGTTPGTYPNSVTIDNPGVSSYVVENLPPGSYEFVVTSFNAAGVESRRSEPATKVIP